MKMRHKELLTNLVFRGGILKTLIQDMRTGDSNFNFEKFTSEVFKILYTFAFLFYWILDVWFSF